MANIRKDPTKIFSFRVRGDMWAFFENFEKETRNRSIIEIIEKSDEFKAFKSQKDLEYLDQKEIFHGKD